MRRFKIDEHTDYKKIIKAKIEAYENKGRGQSKRISEHLKVHSSLVSQVLTGNKNFTIEQAYLITHYFGWNALESNYFMIIYQMNCAGTQELKEHFQKQLGILKKQLNSVSGQIKKNSEELAPIEKAEYYSNWKYMAVWLATSIPDLNTIETLSKKLNISKKSTGEILHFLRKANLCSEKEGKWAINLNKTHLDSDSYLIGNHHRNWRLQAFNRHESLTQSELVFTAPFTVSVKDFEIIRTEILELIKKASERISMTQPELLACLNIDYFFIAK